MHEAGTSVQALAFCKMMQERGYEIELLIGQNQGAFLDSLKTTNISIHALNTSGPFKPLRTIFALMRHFKRSNADIIISGAKGTNMLSIFAHKLSRQASKLILVLTNDIEQKTSKRDKGRRISRHLHNTLYKLSDHIVVLSTAMKDKLLSSDFKENNITYIPPPIDIEAIREKSFEAVNHPWLSNTPSKRQIPVILAVGRLAKQKNYPVLFEAFATLRKTRDARLLIIGSGTKDFQEKLNSNAAMLGITDEIDFHGFDANPYKYMRACDAFVLSSHWEGFGIVLAEALACDMSIASVDCPDGPREILGNGQFGYLSPIYDPLALSQAMIEALDNPKEAKLIKSKADTYGFDNNAALYETLLHSLTLGTKPQHSGQPIQEQ